MTHDQVENLLRAIQRLWPTVPNRAPIDADTIKLWQLVLADIPAEGAEVIVVNASRSGDKFPPTPGDIAHRFHASTDRAAGLAVPDADEAWLEVSTAVQRRGFMAGPPDWSHPAVAAAAESMTWRELCHGDTMVTRAHFLKSYPAIAARCSAAKVLQRTGEALALGGVLRALPSGE